MSKTTVDTNHMGGSMPWVTLDISGAKVIIQQGWDGPKSQSFFLDRPNARTKISRTDLVRLRDSLSIILGEDPAPPSDLTQFATSMGELVRGLKAQGLGHHQAWDMAFQLARGAQS